MKRLRKSVKTLNNLKDGILYTYIELHKFKNHINKRHFIQILPSYMIVILFSFIAKRLSSLNKSLVKYNNIYR